MIELPLSVSIAGLEPGEANPWCRADGAVDARKAIEWVASLGASHGIRSIQLDATLAGIRPRDLDRGARRDVAAMLRRAGLGLSGLDLFIPPAHFSNSAHVDRAIQAVTNAAELLAELAGLLPTQRIVSLVMPADEQILAALPLEGFAQDRGVHLADHRVRESGTPAEPLGAGVDPASILLASLDPAKIVSRLGKAPLSARLSDANELGRVQVGTGRLDRLEYAVALHTAGYIASVIVDLRGVRDQSAGVVRWSNA